MTKDDQQKGLAIPIIVAIAVLVVIVVGVGYFALVKNQTFTPNTTQIVFTSKEECEKTTGSTCKFEMCDYIPEGMTLKEACPPNGPYKGWVAINDAPKNSMPKEIPTFIVNICNNIGTQDFTTKEGQQHTFRGSPQAAQICENGKVWAVAENGAKVTESATFYFDEKGILLDICQALFWRSGCEKFNFISCESENYCV